MIYAEEIERAVLGACLLERTAQSTALKSLRAEMFYITAHRAVFEAISALYARGAAVDMLTVCEELRASGRLDEAGGPFAVAKLGARWLRRLTWSITAPSCSSTSCAGDWWRC